METKQILYRASNHLWRLEIEEIEYLRKTPNYYWIGRHRNAMETTYYKCFIDKEEAIDYLENIINKNINSAEESLQIAKEKLEEFNKIYK